MKKIISAVSITIMLICHCGLGPQNLAGGSTNTSNACVAGSLVNKDGSAARHTLVRCIPSDYIPGLSSQNSIRYDFTDDSGVYAFTSLDSGAYVITAVDTVQLTRCMIQGTVVDHDTVTIPSGTLDVPGFINVSITDTTGFSAGFFYIPGTTITSSLSKTTAAGYVMLDSVPCGIVPAINYASASVTQGRVIRTSITVPPASTVTVNNILWKFTKTIQLNTSSSGADISGTVTDFPVLVRLTNNNFDFGDALSDGSDIKFTKADNTTLPHEIERWDPVAGLAELWVKVDTVHGNDSSSALTMYYGNVNTVSQSTNTQVFDTSNGFFGSYHFGNNLSDATLNHFDGTNSGSANTSDGIIGLARQFDGISNYVNLGDLPDRPAGTISFWFRPGQTFDTSSLTTQGIWGKKTDNSINFNLSLLGKDFLSDSYTDTMKAGNLISKMENTDTGYYLVNTTNEFPSGIWHYATWCWGNDSEKLYVDGTLESSNLYYCSVSGDGNDEIGRSSYDSLANIQDGKARYFYGTLDEFRIDRTARSTDWIKLCYMNQRKDDKLVVFK